MSTWRSGSFANLRSDISQQPRQYTALFPTASIQTYERGSVPWAQAQNEQNQLNTTLASDLQLRNALALQEASGDSSDEAWQRSLYNSQLGFLSGLTNQLGLDDATIKQAKGEYAPTDRDYADVYSRMTGLADDGMYTPAEIAAIQANEQRQVEDKYRGAASSALSKGLGQSINPFGAAAILAEGASEGGKAKADVLSGLTREQAQSRVNATGGLASLLNLRADVDSQKAMLDTKKTNPTVLDMIGTLKDRILNVESDVSSTSSSEWTDSKGNKHKRTTSRGSSGGSRNTGSLRTM